MPNSEHRTPNTKRILYFNPLAGLGGAERVLLAVLGGVRKACPLAQLHLLSTGDGPLLREAKQVARAALRRQ